MDVGFHFFNFTVPGGSEGIHRQVSEVADLADDVGLADLSVMDHWFQMEPTGGPEHPMLEAYSTLAYFAGRTRKVQLQALVTGVTYRHPGLLAKTVTTLDVLSGGRAVLGLGAAWYEREHRGLGVPYPPVTERFERLEETLQICRQMWSDNDGPYHGKHYQLAETINVPQPIRRPPIMIGGGGERKTLRLVARYADACNLFGGGGQEGLDTVRGKLEVLREHCANEGTDYDAIRKTMLFRGLGGTDAASAAKAAEDLAPYADLGVTSVFFTHIGDPARFVGELGEHVIPALSAV